MASLLSSAPATFRYILEALDDGYVETNMIIPQQVVPALSEALTRYLACDEKSAAV
jgi:hypothetical protein